MEYEYKKIAEISLEAGIYILNSLYKNELEQEKFDEYINNAKKLSREVGLGPSTKAILEAAKDRKIPYKRLHPEYSLFALGWENIGKGYGDL